MRRQAWKKQRRYLGVPVNTREDREARLVADLLADLRSDLAFSERTDPNTPEWERHRQRLRDLIARQEARADRVMSDKELMEAL